MNSQEVSVLPLLIVFSKLNHCLAFVVVVVVCCFFFGGGVCFCFLWVFFFWSQPLS